MPYAIRDAEGRIVSLSLQGEGEALPATHPEVLDFLHRGDAFLASDLALLRAVEDLIEVLIAKKVITWTDLPAPVQEKLLSRRTLRAEMQAVMSALGEGEKII